MNLFRRILGTNPDPPVIQEHTPKPMSAGERLDSLESRQSRLEEQIKQEKTKAKSYMDKGNKSAAIKCLQKATHLQTQLDSVVNMSLKYANNVYSGDEPAPSFDIELRKSELESEIEILRAQAKQHLVAKDKQAALVCVKRKQDLQDELDSLKL